MNNQHQDHGAIGGHGGFGSHQHTGSLSTLSNTTPHFTPAHLQNGTPDNARGLGVKPPNEHYAEHLNEYHKLKMAGDKPHFYARTTSSVSRLPGVTPSSVSTRVDADEHGTRQQEGEEPSSNRVWDAMDLGGHGLKSMGASLFRHYPHLRKLYFNHNRLTTLPIHISHLRYLTVLDLSFNQLRLLPPEIGMITTLKRLLLFDNGLEILPFEIGSLYNLEMLGLEGNPMSTPDGQIQQRQLIEHGTTELVRYLREEAPGKYSFRSPINFEERRQTNTSIEPPGPEPRGWHQLLNESEAPEKDRFTVLSWNTLCDRAATQSAYGYASMGVLRWDRRKSEIMSELQMRNADILTLQEVDTENYHEFFAPTLAQQDYKGVFHAKGRARTMNEKEAKVVDGCATFYKSSKYILLQKYTVNYSHEAINRPDMKGEHDVYNRVMPRDHIALLTFLENRQTGSRLIVVNTHLTWEPHLADVKVIQVAILMELLAKKAEEYAKWPPTKDKEPFRYANEDGVDGADGIGKVEPGPSMAYERGTQIPVLVCGDFNSSYGSGVCDLITQGSLPSSHPDLGDQRYGDFTRNGIHHPFSLKSSYGAIGELPFTNWTPDFRAVIDYVWYSTNTLQVAGLLGQVDPNYMTRVPGFPTYHFPSDHLMLMAEYAVKERKERKQVEADFGPPRRESSRQ